eukprot:2061233-Rhodomonas_salina.1
MMLFSDKYLTPEEIGDWQLLWGFVRDRYARNMPHSIYCSALKIVLGLFPTVRAFLGILVIDKVFNDLVFEGTFRQRI